jgi:hypothetical protein
MHHHHHLKLKRMATQVVELPRGTYLVTHLEDPAQYAHEGKVCARESILG